MSNIAPNSANVHKNEVHLAGVLARDPELKYTASGKAVANFTVATTYEKRTEYHRCIAWEQQAEKLAEKFRKGDFIKLAGRLQTRSWEKDGAKRYTTEIVAWNFSDGKTVPAGQPEPLTPDPNRKSGTDIARAILAPGNATTKNAHGVEVSDADIPF